MEPLIKSLVENFDSNYWICIPLILLAGINIPISIDLLLIAAGGLASLAMPEQAFPLLILLTFICWISAWEAYAIGRYFGPKLAKRRLFQTLLHPDKISSLQRYYQNYGWITFLIGRFIPGGVRNALFMSSGMTKMPFSRFIILDLPGCILSSATTYTLGYFFGSHYTEVMLFFKRYQNRTMILLASLLVLYGTLALFRKRRRSISRQSS